jgi:hypothetical protein
MRAHFGRLLNFFLGRKGTPPPSRSAVRLALRIAAYGEKVVLVDTGARIRLERAGIGGAGDLQVLGTRAGGALLIARRR